MNGSSRHKSEKLGKKASSGDSPTSRSESAIRKLRRRLKVLRDYQSDTLSHRAGDIELAVEAVIFEQIMRQQKSDTSTDQSSEHESIRSALENVETAIRQIAEQQQLSQAEHGQLLEQCTKISELVTDFSKAPPQPVFQAPPCEQTVDLVAYETVINQLQQLRKEHNDLIDYLAEHDAPKTEDTSHCSLIHETGDYLLLKQQIEELSAELARAREEKVQTELNGGSIAAAADSDDHQLIAILRNQLLDERQKVVELRLEIDELQARIKSETKEAKATTLSWDEQKALLLKQLEGDDENQAFEPGKATEIRAIVERTDHEVAKRDKEISELKRLLSEQATASQNVAIGAAAVADLLNHDELVLEERENLRLLQEQWRQKLREAEVEISIERAKIARQRQELDEYLKSCQEPDSKREECSKTANGTRWLARLGLSDVAATENKR